MANNNGSKDDKLIQSLYEKLDWFTFQATDEEFDPEQVQAIVKLLDSLDPLPEGEVRGGATAKPDVERKDMSAGKVDVDAAFDRFKKKYNITDEELARKNGKPAAVPKAAESEKIVPFPAEFSAELAIDSTKVHDMAEKEKHADDEKGDVALAVGQLFAESDAAKQSGPVDGAENGTKKYGEGKTAAVGSEDTEAGATGRKTNGRRRFFSGGWGKAAVALLVVVVTGTVLSIGTSAVQQKPFLDVVRDGINGFKVTVTGNEMDAKSEGKLLEDSEDVVYYSSWNEVSEENRDVLIPSYIPEGFELKVLYKQIYQDYWLYRGEYSEQNSNLTLKIKVKYYIGDYAKVGLVNEDSGILVGEDKDRSIRYYKLDDIYLAVWNIGKCIYTFEGNDLDDICNIIDGIE